MYIYNLSLLCSIGKYVNAYNIRNIMYFDVILYIRTGSYWCSGGNHGWDNLDKSMHVSHCKQHRENCNLLKSTSFKSIYYISF